MDKLIAELEDWTQLVIQNLNNIDYEELNRLVNQRQELVDRLNDALAAQIPAGPQKKRILTVLQQDSKIVDQMQKLKDEAADWLRQRNHAKAQRNVYEIGYTPDSILMDRRK